MCFCGTGASQTGIPLFGVGARLRVRGASCLRLGPLALRGEWAVSSAVFISTKRVAFRAICCSSLYPSARPRSTDLAPRGVASAAMVKATAPCGAMPSEILRVALAIYQRVRLASSSGGALGDQVIQVTPSMMSSGSSHRCLWIWTFGLGHRESDQ